MSKKVDTFLETVSSGNENICQLNEIKNVAKNAKQNKVIYTINGNFGALRHALNTRGWVEKCSFDQFPRIKSMPLNKLMLKAEKGNIFEIAAISKLLSSTPANFIWNARCQCPNSSAGMLPYKNHIRYEPECNFTTKAGLALCAKSSHWHLIPGVAELTVPRSFILRNEDERESFLQNFRLTACISLVLFVNQHPNVLTDDGQIDRKWIDFALNRIQEAINVRKHFDIDTKALKLPNTEELWGKFLGKCEDIIHNGKHFKDQFGFDFQDQMHRLNKFVGTISELWPFAEMDGTTNTWVAKPWNTNRGVGILLFNKAEELNTFLISDDIKRYVVQKYVERPLLIHKTKFDIRQHFLIKTNAQSQEIWMYRRCYFRFSSHEFSLETLNTSVHLTNHAVQKLCTNSSTRSALIPSFNMWTLEQFQDFLTSIGYKNLWKKRIYPAMKQNIIAVVLCAQEKACFDVNAFEIFGCDFLLTEQFDTVLLEINSNPNLSASTPVTEHFCPKLIDDLVKVVVDLSKSPSSSTGEFERIYQLPGAVNADVKKLNLEAKNYFQLQQQERNHKLYSSYKNYTKERFIKHNFKL